MKVGIITFHRAINYGAVLQTHALQKTLKKLGAEADVLDYRCDHLEKNYSILQRLKHTKGPKSFAAVFIKCALPAIKKKLTFHRWMNKNCILSRSYREDITETNADYDLFITGSDQVWNYAHTDFDKNYFLNFVEDNQKKFSYAASFGFSQLDQKYWASYRTLLETFSGISVREASGAALIGNLLDKAAVPVVVDPVFLLQKQDWQLRQWHDTKKYILVYELMPSPEVLRFALQLAEKHDLQVIRITNTLQRGFNPRVKNVYGISPQSFLEYIYNAQYVVTNSFHGTAFSILFNKQFYVCRLTDTMSALNARLDDLLALCGLKNRIVEADYDHTEIDYTPINTLIDCQRQKGITYLKDTVLKNSR